MDIDHKKQTHTLIYIFIYIEIPLFLFWGIRLAISISFNKVPKNQPAFVQKRAKQEILFCKGCIPANELLTSFIKYHQK